MARSLREISRIPVVNARGRRIGRIREALFDPAKNVVVGYQVERPRLLFLLDRRDRYLARDRVTRREEQLVVSAGRDAWDAAAAKRLGIEWDETVIWYGMPVRTVSGQRLGTVRDALFDEATGALEAVGLTGGLAADAALGVRDIEAALVHAFDGEAIVVSDVVAERETSGGAAHTAGRAAAVAKVQAGEAAKAAGAAAKKAGAYGMAAVKAAAASETGKKTVGWLKSLRDEVADAMGDPDDETDRR